MYKRVKKHLIWPKYKPEKPPNPADVLEEKIWRGAGKTAERLDFVPTPVNKRSSWGMTRKKSSDQRPHRHIVLYVIKFTAIQNPQICFLKIGITGSALDVRFRRDLGRFSMETVCISPPLRQKRAILLESSIQRHFSKIKFRPPIPLLSEGNSECFVFSEDNLLAIKSVVDTFSDTINGSVA